jgi:hypothetical protein
MRAETADAAVAVRSAGGIVAVMERVAWLLVVLALAACTRTKIAGQCAESANLRCMTKKVCSWDQARGCQVCTCEAAWDPDHHVDPATPTVP